MSNSFFLPFHMRVTLVWLLSSLWNVWSCSPLAAGRRWSYLWQELSLVQEEGWECVAKHHACAGPLLWSSGSFYWSREFLKGMI